MEVGKSEILSLVSEQLFKADTMRTHCADGHLRVLVVGTREYILKVIAVIEGTCGYQLPIYTCGK